MPNITIETHKSIEYVTVYVGPIRLQRLDDSKGHVKLVLDDVSDDKPIVLYDSEKHDAAKLADADKTFESWASMTLDEARKNARQI